VALVRRSLGKSLLYTVAGGAVIAASAPFVIRFALGDEFRGAAKPLLLLLPGAVAYAPVQILVVYLSVRRGRPRLSLAAGVVAMLVTVALSFPLIEAYGPSGAAAASATGYGCGALVAWVLFRRLAGTRPRTTQPRQRSTDFTASA
jgi:O-antigen/teichoic acid export membrane protein